MTGIEKYLESNGWILTTGNRGPLTGYGNVARSWRKGDKQISIGLIKNLQSMGSQIGIYMPMIDFMPSGDYEQYLENYWKEHKNEEYIDGKLYTTIWASSKKYNRIMNGKYGTN